MLAKHVCDAEHALPDVSQRLRPVAGRCRGWSGLVAQRDVVVVGGAGGLGPLRGAGLVQAESVGEVGARSRAASASSALWRPGRLMMS